MSFIVRCRYVPNGYKPGGVGFLDREARCTTALWLAVRFDEEAEAWDFARTSGERVPEDCWAEDLSLALAEPKADDYD